MTIRGVDGEEYHVLDVHQHLPADADLQSDCAARLAFMDRFGIDQACLSPPMLTDHSLGTSDLNRRVVTYARQRPDRFPFALGTVDVRGGEREIRELEAFSKLGLSGVVWHHMFQGAFIDHPAMTEALTFCERARMPAFVHVIAGSLLEAPWRLARLCERFPDVTFIAMDALSTPHHADWTIEIARHVDNLFVDTAVLSSYGNAIEKFAHAVGPERLLAGTDFEAVPKAFSFPYPIYEVLYSSLTGEAKGAILGENARRVLAS